MSAIQELHAGAMYKCGGKYKSWNKRVFILKSDYHLYYFKTGSKIPQGNISLHDPKFSVRKGEANDVIWPKFAKTDCRMAVVTTTRTYFMYTDYSHEIEEWLEVLSNAAVKANKDISGGKKLPDTTPTAITGQTSTEDSSKPNVNTQALEYEESQPSIVAAGIETSTAESVESEYSLASEVQSFSGDYIDVPLPTPLSTQQQDSNLYEPITEDPNQGIYDSVTDVMTGYAPMTSQQNPSLPPRNDEPGRDPRLPNREEAPPLLDTGERPPLPDRNEAPPLPDTGECPPLPDRDEAPPLPDTKERPPLPDKEEVPPLPDREDAPPLPDKKDPSSGNMEYSLVLVDENNTNPLPSKDGDAAPTSTPQTVDQHEALVSSTQEILVSSTYSSGNSGHSTPSQQSPQTPKKSQLQDEFSETNPFPQRAAEEPVPAVRRDSTPVPRTRKNTSPAAVSVTPLLTALHELFSGVMYKCGGKVKSWTKRFFILKSDFCLYYYKDTSRGPLGTISLLDPKFRAREGEAVDISWPKLAKSDCRMTIITTLRTYFMYCDHTSEIEQWLDILNKAAAKAKQSREGTSLLTKLRAATAVNNQEIKEKEDEISQVTSTTEADAIETPAKSVESSTMTEISPAGIDKDKIEVPVPEAVSSDHPSDDVQEQDVPQENENSIYALASEASEDYNNLTTPTTEATRPEESYEPVSAEPDTIYEAILAEQKVDDLVSAELEGGEPGFSEPTEISQPTAELDSVIYDTVTSDIASSRDPPDSYTAEVTPPSVLPDKVAPPLPDKEERPPIPDKEALPLPDKDERPPLPDKEEAPPLPDKEERPPLLDEEEAPEPPPRNLPPVPTRRESLRHIEAPHLETKVSLEEIKDNSPTLPIKSQGQSSEPPLGDNSLRNSSTPATRKSPECQEARATNSTQETEHSVPNEPSNSRPVPRPRTNTNPSQGRATKPRSATEYPEPEPRGQLSEEGHTVGQQMFQKRRERIDAIHSENKKTEMLQNTLEDIKSDTSVTQSQVVTIAETLREVEQERQIASEERFRWERERKKLEEERLRFEEEKERMKQEMLKMQKQTQDP